MQKSCTYFQFDFAILIAAQSSTYSITCLSVFVLDSFSDLLFFCLLLIVFSVVGPLVVFFELWVS